MDGPPQFDPQAASRRRRPWLWLLGGCGCLMVLPLLWTVWLGIGLVSRALNPQGPAPTVAGPEATDLLPKLKGAIVLNEDGQAQLIQLPSLKRRRIAAASPETPVASPS